MKWGGPLFLGASLLLTLSSGSLFKKSKSDISSGDGAVYDKTAGGTDYNSSSPPGSSGTSGTSGTGAGTNSSTPPSGTGGPGTGQDRQWRGYVPTDVEALRAQLPPSAKHLAEAFVSAGQQYNVDPLFLASISKLETGSWTSNAFINKNNAMGISDASGPTMQSSHQSSINTMAASLSGASGTAGHYNGLNTVGEVGVKYAPDGAVNDFNGTNSQWGQHVGNNYDNFVNSLR